MYSWPSISFEVYHLNIDMLIRQRAVRSLEFNWSSVMSIVVLKYTIAACCGRRIFMNVHRVITVMTANIWWRWVHEYVIDRANSVSN
jgi:hypothetical protein